jgi:hypothetical protein
LRLVYDPAADGSNIKCNSTRDDGDGSNSNSNSNSSLLSASTRLLGPLGLTYACQPHPSEPCWPGSSDTICDDSFGTGTFFLIGNPGRLFTARLVWCSNKQNAVGGNKRQSDNWHRALIDARQLSSHWPVDTQVIYHSPGHANERANETRAQTDHPCVHFVSYMNTVVRQCPPFICRSDNTTRAWLF